MMLTLQPQAKLQEFVGVQVSDTLQQSLSSVQSPVYVHGS